MTTGVVFTDLGTPQPVLDAEGHVVMVLPRYAVWGDKGRGKAEVIECSDDLEELKAKWGNLPLRVLR